MLPGDGQGKSQKTPSASRPGLSGGWDRLVGSDATPAGSGVGLAVTVLVVGYATVIG